MPLADRVFSVKYFFTSYSLHLTNVSFQNTTSTDKPCIPSTHKANQHDAGWCGCGVFTPTRCHADVPPADQHLPAESVPHTASVPCCRPRRRRVTTPTAPTTLRPAAELRTVALPKLAEPPCRRHPAARPHRHLPTPGAHPTPPGRCSRPRVACTTQPHARRPPCT